MGAGSTGAGPPAAAEEGEATLKVGPSSRSWWRLISASERRTRPREPRSSRIVDPTKELLEELTDVRSPTPWIPIGIVALVLLWFPSWQEKREAPFDEAEQRWVAEVSGTADRSAASEFSRALSRASWGEAELVATAEAPPATRRAVRAPSAAAALVALAVFFFLVRLVAGDAAALLSATLLAISAAWIRAGTSALPLIEGEALVLAGVVWALVLQDRHREVELAGVTATRIGVAGVFLGIGLLLAPAAFATLLATLLVWLLLGLRRSRSEATTLPVENPAETTFFAVFGAFCLLGSALIAAWGAERLAGGSGLPFLSLFGSGPEPAAWREFYRDVLSPLPATDWILMGSIAVILGVRLLEWRSGRQWEEGGLVPWVFVGLYLLALTGEGASRLRVPVTVPPLFVLGLGWMILRGLRPGRIRRQEYTFLFAWLVIGALLVPLVSGAHPHDPRLAATVTLLPAILLVVGRAARALWENEGTVLARIGILVLTFLPVVTFGLGAITTRLGAPAATGFADTLRSNLLWILVAATGLGALSEIVTVRPDEVSAPRPAGIRRLYRRGRHRSTKRRAAKRGGHKRR